MISKKTKTTIFEDFEGLDEKRETKPVIFFFYTDPSSTKDRSKAVLNCQQMVRLLGDKKVSPILAKFLCYKRNYETTDKSILKKYNVKTSPMIVIFDATGKVLYRLSSPKTKPDTLAATLEAIAKKSDKNLKNAQEKRERKAKKEAKKPGEDE